MSKKIKLFFYSLLLRIAQGDLEYFDSDIFNSLGHFDKTRQKYVRRIKKLQNKVNELGGNMAKNIRGEEQLDLTPENLKEVPAERLREEIEFVKSIYRADVKSYTTNEMLTHSRNAIHLGQLVAMVYELDGMKGVRTLIDEFTGEQIDFLTEKYDEFYKSTNKS